LDTLTELYCSHNLITEITPLQNKKLATLDVGNNQIKNLSGLENLELLEELWVCPINEASYNQLSSFQEIEQQLASKAKLTTVYFEGNPIQTDGRPQYRIKLKTLLPYLKQIDATIIRTGE
jgi:protein phosphatase 1 regulatory subunit 7